MPIKITDGQRLDWLEKQTRIIQRNFFSRTKWDVYYPHSNEIQFHGLKDFRKAIDMGIMADESEKKLRKISRNKKL